VKRALWLAGVSVVARTPGFLIPVIVGSVFGAGLETDAYFLAYGAVLLIAGTLGQAIEAAIVPFSAAELTTTRGRFEDRSAKLVLLATIPLWIVVAPLVSIASPNGMASRVGLYILFLSPMVLCWPVCAAYSGALVARWDIAGASLSVLWRGGGALLGVLVAMAGPGLPAVAAGLSLGELARVLWLRRRVWRSAPADSAAAPDPGVFGRAAAAQVLAGGTGAIPPFVERFLATTLGSGSVSRLEYANRLLVVPAVLFEGGLAPLLLARWSNERAAGRSPPVKQVLVEIGRGLLLAALLAALIVLLAPMVVKILLGHGRLTAEDLAAISRLLRYLALGFVATMGALLLERLYLAHARNRWLAGLALIRAGLRIGVLIVLLPRLGLLAFPAGYAAGEWVYLLSLIAGLKRASITV
jgi:putative peptidoglycan lipid II flippase